MCNAYKLDADLTRIGKTAVLQLQRSLWFPVGANAETSNMDVPKALFPKREGLFLVPTAEGELAPTLGRWGLVHVGHKGPLKAIRATANNCRSETMASKWPFIEAFRRRRCVIPLTGFTEWTGPEGRKTAHAITATDHGLLWAAGLWNETVCEDGLVTSYTMVMTDVQPEDDMDGFHDRQPVFLDRVTASTWLDVGADPAPILKALPKGSLTFTPPDPVPA